MDGEVAGFIILLPRHGYLVLENGAVPAPPRARASDHATCSLASMTMESSGRSSRANGRAYGGATRYPLQRLLA